jgi:predicted nucleic acid-binding protein
MALRLLLVDKSAYVRGTLDRWPEDELCLCAVTRLELLYSARSQRSYVQL